jgi:hypothetical protein
MSNPQTFVQSTIVMTKPPADLIDSFGTLSRMKKAALAALIRVGLTREENMQPVPYLAKFAVRVYSSMDVQYKNITEEDIITETKVKKAAVVRLVYLRFIFNQFQIEQLRKPGQKHTTAWELVDKDLKARLNKSPAYQYAFAKLIIDTD